jgi:flagellar biosynthesis GTPase FlhF
MRIKSYFASSVQSAIAIARKEYGDDVTLVTSHTAPLESRHLGDYEVVFAVDETPLLVPPPAPKKNSTQIIKAAAPAVESSVLVADPVPELVASVAEPAPAAPAPFQELLQEAIATPLSTDENVPEKLERVHSILVEMGIDSPMVRALMTMIERTVSAQIPAQASVVETAEPEAIAMPIEAEAESAAVESVAPGTPDLTPAELAFYLSVSVGS